MKLLEQPILLIVVGISLFVSAIHPYDGLTWLLEVSPILIAAPVLVATYRRFPLTPLLYRLIFIHSLILIAGGHYTYARVPVGTWAQSIFHLARNHYDRLGHFAQGFIPAMVAREILLRMSPLNPGKWLFFLVVCVCLAFSAFYEFIEWWMAAIIGQAATDFLGTQGDVWDTQWDMFMAFAGAITAQLTLSRLHDRQLDGLKTTETPARAAKI
jgi:putative membrane protein